MDCNNKLTSSLSAGLILGLCSLTSFLAFLHEKIFISRTPTFSFRFTAKRFYKLRQKNIELSVWHIVSEIDRLREKKEHENNICVVQQLRESRGNTKYTETSLTEIDVHGAQQRSRPLEHFTINGECKNHEFLLSQGKI